VIQGRDELILAHLCRRHLLERGAQLIVQGCNPERVGGDDNPPLSVLQFLSIRLPFPHPIEMG
jgi:hypothetical protein